MNEKKDLPLSHCIFFIYHCFSAYSDGEIKGVESKLIEKFIYRWVRDNPELANQVIKETIDWKKENVKNAEEAIGYMSSMVDFLNSQDSFDINQKEHFLLDIREIARIDGHFHEAEKKWHDLIAQQLNVSLRISQNSVEEVKSEIKNINKRKPMGFKMSNSS